MPPSVRVQEAIDDYLDYRENVAGMAANTLRTNRASLKALAGHLGDIQMSSVGHRHIEGFFADMGKRWGASTMNVRRSHVAEFLRFSQSRGWMRRDINLMENTRQRKVMTRDRLRIPVQEFPTVLDAAMTPRDRIVMALGLFLFLRASEIRYLKIADLHLDRDEVFVTVLKTQETDTMPISAPLRQELTRWLGYYTQNIGALKPEFHLAPSMRAVPGIQDPATGRFVARDGDWVRLKPHRPVHQPEGIVSRTLTRLGYPVYREGIHTLRRSGARALFDELADSGYDRALEVVSSMLHHKQMSTTQLYLGLSESKARRDELLKGQPMFTGMQRGNNVLELPVKVESL